MNTQILDLRDLEVEAETVETLDLLAQWQSMSRAQVIQRLLREGARQAKLEYTAQLFGEGEITLERAAEMAGVTIYDMMAYVQAQGILPPRDMTELRTDIVRMLQRTEHSELADRILRENQ